MAGGLTSNQKALFGLAALLCVSLVVRQSLTLGRPADRLVARFDAEKAKCRYDRDRQRLLAVIEASFGTTTPFNQHFYS